MRGTIKFENLGTWKFRAFGIWKFENIEIIGFGKLINSLFYKCRNTKFLPVSTGTRHFAR